MNYHTKNTEKVFTQAYQDFLQIRPCQMTCIAGGSMSVALAALGLSFGGVIGGTIALTTAATGHLFYNSYQVLRNLQKIEENPTICISKECLKKNTLFFDWAAKHTTHVLIENELPPALLLKTLDKWVLAQVATVQNRFKELRPSQKACMAGIAASISLIVLGLTIETPIGGLTLITGIATGYFFYNSYHVLSNAVDFYNLETPIPSLENPISSILSKNTLFFNFGVEKFTSLPGNTLWSKLDYIDETLPNISSTIDYTAKKIFSFPKNLAENIRKSTAFFFPKEPPSSRLGAMHEID